MRVFRETTNVAYKRIVEHLHDQDVEASRFGDTKEDMSVIVRSEDPRKRMFFRPGINWAFGLQEAYAYWNGLNPGHVQRYNPKMEEFMYQREDERRERLHGSAYGRYLRHIPHDQLRRVYNTLDEDPESRRCIINIHQAGVEDYDRGDVACTVYLHPIIRDGQLNMTTCLRSQDMLWGYPYDVQAFQWIQEALAGALEVDLGWYEHRMNSCHYYMDREDEMFESITRWSPQELPDCTLDEATLDNVIAKLGVGLVAARDDEVPSTEIDWLEERSTFYADWLRVMTAYERAKLHDDKLAAHDVKNEIETPAFDTYVQRVLSL